MPERLNVLYVITKSNWGGAQRYVFDLATHLQEDSFDVAVAYGQSGALADKLHEAGVATHDLGSLQRDLSLTADLRSFFELYRLFKKERPDIVHLNSSKAGGVGALAGRLAGVKKIVFTAHGWPFMERRGSLWRFFAWLGSWATALFSHTVICVSEYDRGLGEQLPFCASKMVRIHNGIDLSLQFGSGDIIRRAFPAGARITGTVGELTKNKNQISLIEAARKDSSMHVAIVGEGELRPMLEAKIREYGLESRVKLFGFVPAAEVLKGFDTFALPSLKEGLPYILLEAKAANLPITANRVGGVGEILDASDMSEFSLERMLEQTMAVYRS